MEVVKVQVPIVGEHSAYLVYDRSRVRVSVQSIPEHADEALQLDLKGYFHATWVGISRKWVIHDRVDDERW
jgi:hypothetical protein